MNNIYIYNNNLFSLLSLIIYLIDNCIKPYDIKNCDYNPTLFDNIIKLNINYNKDIIKNINKMVLKYIIDVFLSNNLNKEIIIYYFYKNYLKYGIKVIYMYNLNCVNHVIKISKYVRNEAHKYKGFIRFKELENKVLFAEIEPVNNILPLISKHFKKRLCNEYFIIKDNTYGLICIYAKNNLEILSQEEIIINTEIYSKDEEKYQNMWKCFYNTISIKSRLNERCRMNFMPKRYWKYLIEMSDEI